ncbi:MAG: gas vesicle protein GvpG [Propionibacteriales bacterium]|nr:gas vesicle protein GvpG [Propionibacteriales bacterium]
MGLITGLVTGVVTWPLAPVRGTLWVAEQVLQEAERQWYDPATIQRELDDIASRRDAGDLTADEADRLEEDLVQRLLDGPVGHG